MASAGALPESEPIRFLVVEDSDRDYALLVRELSRAGLHPVLHRVMDAQQMRAALAEGGWHAVISDHSLPHFSSTEALQIFRAAKLDIPFIIVSGAIGEEQAVDSMKAGATDYVSKRNLSRLIPVLERELRDAHARSERRRMEAEVARLNRESETRLRQRSTLLDINNAVVANLDRASLFQSTFEALRKTLACDCLMLVLRDQKSGEMETFSLQGSGAPEASPVRREEARALLGAWAAGDTGYLLCADTESDRTFPLTEHLRSSGLRSAAAAPLIAQSETLGVLIAASRGVATYSAADGEFLMEACRQIALAIANMLAHEQIAALTARLEQDKAYLLEEIKIEHNFDEMVGASLAFLDLSRRISLVAPTTAPVLILGETGTGKELIARALHNLSPRRNRPLVKVNCAAISAGLVESELFGHVKGAFTGAVEKRIGRFEFANEGTLFLDEVGELPLDTQAKLLRVLQEQEFEPVGSNRTIRVDTRVIAATNRNLEKAVAEGAFRSDLYYRLNVVPIRVPPLRERAADIPRLVAFFLAGLSRKFGRHVESVTEEAMQRMLAYAWPGNVRELESTLARAVVLSESPVLDAEALGLVQPANGDAPNDATRLEDAERQHIRKMLAQTQWLIEGPNGAARLLGLHPNTLRSRMKKLGIRRPS